MVPFGKIVVLKKTMVYFLKLVSIYNIAFLIIYKMKKAFTPTFRISEINDFSKKTLKCFAIEVILLAINFLDMGFSICLFHDPDSERVSIIKN